VHHQARKYGVTKFGLDRFVNGYLDLATLWFQSKFGIKPMHIFGLLGSLMFLVGFIATLTVLILKIVSMCSDGYNFYVTKSVYFYLSLTAMVMGLQFFLTGFIGELITRNSPERNNYLIGEEW
ncbi:MAG: glycosyltransferase, partial [Muribaculaceae bacterium]|nr:glycosyltransferase [Muribaculaceae bacterium]